MGPTFNRLISLSFHVHQPSHSWDTAISKFDLGNPRLRSLVRLKFKVTKWIKLLIDSRPFCSTLYVNQPPYSQDMAFQNLTLKIQGQGHSSRSQWVQHPIHSYNFHSINLYVNWQSHYWDLYSSFKILHWKTKVKVIGQFVVQSHQVGLASYQLTSPSCHVN